MPALAVRGQAGEGSKDLVGNDCGNAVIRRFIQNECLLDLGHNRMASARK